MKSVRYSKYSAEDLGLSAEDLLKALSDFFLQSGFENQYMQFTEMNEQTMEALKDASRRALEQGDMFDQSQADQIRETLEQMSPEELDKLLDRLAQKLVKEGYLSTEGEPDPQSAPRGGRGQQQGKV